MKVLWTHNFNPSIEGSGIFMHNMVDEFKKFDINIELMYLGDLNTMGNIISARDKLSRYSKSFDLVHSQFGSACSFVSCASKVPCLLTLRGSDWHCYLGSDFKESFHGLLANTLTRIAIPYFDIVITMSNRMSNGVRKFNTGVQVETIADPVDTDLFKPMIRAEARSRLFNSKSTSPWVLFTSLSSTNPVKRVNLAIQAVKIASKYIPRLELKVASGIPHNQMPLFVNSCNLALCTSTHEGWPNSLKEALACGLPFVSTDVSDLHTIADRHDNCMIAPPVPSKLAEMIVNSLSLQSDDSLKYEVANMTLNSSCGKIADLYTSLLNRYKF